ncbi:hypothetical protein ILUMI_18840 [Ignelater luminosus]|uniref:Uncharacterized protein n=1 Tax=Ignelater luminosus TaxID=2038154 RepID=A0A8K0CKH4_IGNLU|nr:hypothetical protein ILUMI_18840 [Ignelater luminosus]
MCLRETNELEGLLESNSKHEGKSTSNSENEAYSRVLRKSSESNSTSDIQASDTTLENSLSVASCSYKTSDVKRSNSSDLTVTKNKPQRILCHRNVQSKSNLIQKKKKEFLLEENQTCTSKDGTKWKSRRGVPELGKSSRGDLYETVLLKTDNDNYILTICQAKPNKNVLLLSTLHNVTINRDEKKKKPETVPYYSDTKYGVDVPDQMARKYTVNASYKRLHTIQRNHRKKIKRRDFLLELAEQLAEEYKSKEAVKEGTSRKKEIDKKQAATETRIQKRKTCQTQKCENKTYDACVKCKPFYWPTNPNKKPDLLDSFISKTISASYVKLNEYDPVSGHS